jgi:hypothetical protein
MFKISIIIKAVIIELYYFMYFVLKNLIEVTL